MKRWSYYQRAAASIAFLISPVPPFPINEPFLSIFPPRRLFYDVFAVALEILSSSSFLVTPFFLLWQITVYSLHLLSSLFLYIVWKRFGQFLARSTLVVLMQVMDSYTALNLSSHPSNKWRWKIPVFIILLLIIHLLQLIKHRARTSPRWG